MRVLYPPCREGNSWGNNEYSFFFFFAHMMLYYALFFKYVFLWIAEINELRKPLTINHRANKLHNWIPGFPSEEVLPSWELPLGKNCCQMNLKGSRIRILWSYHAVRAIHKLSVLNCYFIAYVFSLVLTIVIGIYLYDH